MEFKSITIRAGDDYQATIPDIGEKGPIINEGTVLFNHFAENNASQDFLSILSKIYHTGGDFFDRQNALSILHKCDNNLEKALYHYFHPRLNNSRIIQLSDHEYSDFYCKITKEMELKDSLKLVDLQLKTNENLASKERVTYDKLVKHKNNLKSANISLSSQQLLEDILVSAKKWEDYLKLNTSFPQTLLQFNKLREDTAHRFPFLKSKEITMIKETIETANNFVNTAEVLINKVAVIKKSKDNITEINRTIKEITLALQTSKKLEGVLADISYKGLANTLSAYLLIMRVYIKKEKGVYYTGIEYLKNKLHLLKIFNESVKEDFLGDAKIAQDLNKRVEKLLIKHKDTEANQLASTAKQLPFHSLDFSRVEKRVKKTFFLDRATRVVQQLGNKSLQEEDLWALEEGSKKFLNKNREHSLFGTIDSHMTELLKLKYSLSKLLGVNFPHVGVRNINYSNVTVNSKSLSLEDTDKLIRAIKRSPFLPTEYLKKIQSVYDVSVSKKKRMLEFVGNKNVTNEDSILKYEGLKELNDSNTHFIDIYITDNSKDLILLEQFKKSVSKCLKVKTKLEHILTTTPIKEKDIKQILAILANDAVLKRVELEIKEKAVQRLEESKKLTAYISSLSLNHNEISNNKEDDEDVIDITIEDNRDDRKVKSNVTAEIEFYELSENLNRGKKYRNFVRKDNYNKAVELVKKGNEWLESIKNKMPGIDTPVNKDHIYNSNKNVNKRSKQKLLDIGELKQIINSKPIELQMVRFGRLEDMVYGFINNVEKLRTDIDQLHQMKIASIKSMTEKDVQIVVNGFMSLLNPILSLNVEVGFKEHKHRDSFLVLKCFHSLFNLTKTDNYVNSYIEFLNILLPFTTNCLYIVFSKSLEFKSLLQNVTACLKWSSKVNYKLFDYFNEATYYILGINYQLDNTRKLGSLLSIDYKRLEDMKLDKEDHKVEVFCYCKIPHDDELFMLMCDSCLQWYHLECALLGSSDVNNDQDSFNCLECCVESGQKFKFMERILWVTKDTRPSKFGIIKTKPDTELIGSFISDFRGLKLKNIKMHEVEKLEKVLLGVSEWVEEADKIIKQLKSMNKGSVANIDRLLVQRAFSYMCKGAANYLKTSNLNELMKHLLDSVIILNIESFYKSQLNSKAMDFNWKGIFGFTYSKQKLNFKELEVLYKRLFKFGFVEVTNSSPAMNGKKGEVEKTIRIKRSTTHVKTFLDFYSRAMNIHESLNHALNEKTTLDEADKIIYSAVQMKVIFFENLKPLKEQLMKIRKVSEKVTELMRTKTLTYSKIIALSNELSVDGGKIVSPVKQLLAKEKKKADDWTSRFHKIMGSKNVESRDLLGLMKELQGASRVCVDVRDIERLRRGIKMIQSGVRITEEVKNSKKVKVVKSNFKYCKSEQCFIVGIKKGLIGLLKKNKTTNKGVMFVKNYLDGIPLRVSSMNESRAISDLSFAKVLQQVDVSSDFEELKSKLTPYIKKLLDSGKLKLDDCKRLMTTRNQTQQLLMNYIIKLEKLCPLHGNK